MDLNHRPPPLKGGALALSYSGIEVSGRDGHYPGEPRLVPLEWLGRKDLNPHLLT